MSLPRRRKKQPAAAEECHTFFPDGLHERIGGDDKSLDNRKRRRKRRKKKRNITRKLWSGVLCGCVFIAIVYASGLSVVGVLPFWIPSNHSSITSVLRRKSSRKGYLRSLFRFERTSLAPGNVALYEDLFELRGGYDMFSSEISEQDVPAHQRRPYKLSSYYGENITLTGCNLTVIFMDPRIPTLRHGMPAWYALESVATFAPYSCVILQTALCELKSIEDNIYGPRREAEVRKEAMDIIYNHSLPLFRNMIEQGRVRVTFLDHTKYKLHTCSDFSNPSAAWMNVYYWNDEFLDSDSDLVLIIQDDAVLCHDLDSDQWREYAYVGALWPKVSTKLNPHPLEGMCLGMPNRWSTWLMPQRRWERQQTKLKQSPESVAAEKRAPRPETLLNTTFPSVCGGGTGPIGNGGLSLRSRKWLIKAIETCPHPKYSGIDINGKAFACKVFEDINEDFYFGVVLRGLGAPLPSALDASRFATEMIWPEDALRLYGNKGPQSTHSTSKNRAGTDQISVGGNSITVPVGLHKPWWYHPNSLLQSAQMHEACPFLKYVFDPQLSKWKEFSEEAPWIGIGS